ncbi:MAG: carboxypeptidase-like regulatory domain-containing protein [Tepidisphaeraceae bacterium]
MFRLVNSFAPVVALIALAMFASHAVRADDAPASQPSSPSGSIVVTVLDSSGKPVVKASVKLYNKKKKSDVDANGETKKPKAISTGKTDEDGKYTFSGLASGDYKINASYKKTGSKASATVNITDDAPNGTVTINFAAVDAGNGGATTAPSGQ